MAPVVEYFVFGEEKKPHKMLNGIKIKSWSIPQCKRCHMDMYDKYTKRALGQQFSFQIL